VRQPKSGKEAVADAQYNFGLLFEKGDCVEQNSTRAAHWFLKAAEQDHPLAQNAIAELYHKSRGV
jgi:TPR repeat protein